MTLSNIRKVLWSTEYGLLFDFNTDRMLLMTMLHEKIFTFECECFKHAKYFKCEIILGHQNSNQN